MLNRPALLQKHEPKRHTRIFKNKKRCFMRRGKTENIFPGAVR